MSFRAMNVGAALKISSGLLRKNPVKIFTFNFFKDTEKKCFPSLPKQKVVCNQGSNPELGTYLNVTLTATLPRQHNRNRKKTNYTNTS